MPASNEPSLQAATSRTPLHRRSIDVQVYARADGLWELDAQLQDVKSRDFPLATGVRPAGVPVHEMTLRILFDSGLTILDVSSSATHAPYPGHCDEHGDAYRRLIGLNFLKGFRQAVKERVGGSQACTHLTEMAQVLPTAVIQALAGEVIDTQSDGSSGNRRPFQIDHCHALRADGPIVQQYYPRWFRPGASPGTSVLSATPSSHPLPSDRSQPADRTVAN